MGFEDAKYKAIKYLGISKKTEYEVSAKLRNYGCDDEVIEKVIDYLIELGYINDLDYIDSYLRQNSRMQKYSIYEIIEKLKQKGIKANKVEERINILLPNDYEEKIIQKLINLKSRTLDENKVKQYLYRRGFKNQ